MIDDIEGEVCHICGEHDEELWECVNCGREVCEYCSVGKGDYRECVECLEQ